MRCSWDAKRPKKRMLPLGKQLKNTILTYVGVTKVFHLRRPERNGKNSFIEINNP